ncbi:MAG: GTPase HflX, partial [Planctomycetota bacterium]|nr:GTPase HflX [Planctomycetota bacterium]
IGLRGPGEKQLEEDRRVISRRVTDLKREIKEIERRKQRMVESRSHFQICLVGYTNAGKTTLLNRLTGAREYVSRKLFSTLDTRTRLWHLFDGKEVLLSDTVGFIRNIPHHLVASFHATLEEVISADLLLHVVDSSDPSAEVMIHTVEDVLKELHSDHIARILLLNKSDRIRDPMELSILKRRMPDAILISAKTGEGLNDLAEAVIRFIEKDWKTVKVTVPTSNWEVLSILERQGRLLNKRFQNNRAHYTVRISPSILSKIVNIDGVRVNPLPEEGEK